MLPLSRSCLLLLLPALRYTFVYFPVFYSYSPSYPLTPPSVFPFFL